VLTGLNVRQSSAILNEIAPDRAAKLVNTISGLVPPDGKKS
jgi:flagellar motility protein MotE (MotC chaperone)